MTTSETYVTAAYLVFLGILLLYLVVHASKLARLEREVARIRLPEDEPERSQREVGVTADREA